MWKWLKKKYFLVILFILSLPFLYICSLVLISSLRYLNTQNEINQRIDGLKNAFGSGNQKTIIQESLYFETPLILLNQKDSPSKIYDRNKRVIGEFSHPGVEFIQDIRGVPSYFVKSLLAMEDRKFYAHSGYNIKSIARAAFANLSAGRVVQGGSTITQQLAKILFTTRKKKVSRKLYELYCARKLEKTFTKNEILLLYSNMVYFGHGTEGLSQVAKTFFKKKPSYLNAVECTHLVSMIANPTFYSPYLYPERSKRRHWVVLEQLAKTGGISLSYAKRTYEKYWDGIGLGKRRLGFNFWTMSRNEAPYYTESVRQMLAENFSRSEILKNGLSIHTGLDIDFDRIGHRVLSKHLQRHRENGLDGIEGALIALDNITGEVITAVGGSGFSVNNQMRRYEQASRPVGSLAKPLIYLLAFKELERTPLDLLNDEPMEIKIPGRIWRPQNYDREFQGEMSYSKALVTSRNIPAIQLLKELGVKKYRNYIMGAFADNHPHVQKDLSIALGSYSLTPLQVVGLYARFARDGEPISPVMLSHVIDRFQGKSMDQRDVILKNSSPRNQIYTLPYYYLYSELEKVLRDPSGTGYRAHNDNPLGVIRAAGKTGTTQDRRDAWFVGFTPQITCAVWVGFDDNRAMEKGSGGSLAAPYLDGIY